MGIKQRTYFCIDMKSFYRKLKLDDELIKFDDVYAITVIDV